MGVKLKIRVTKEILRKSAMCGHDGLGLIGTNCAIALAVRDIFPKTWVDDELITTDFTKSQPFSYSEIPLPDNARIFITEFDKATPEERVNMSELEFTIDIPEEAIERINIDELRPLLQNHSTLELIEK